MFINFGYLESNSEALRLQYFLAKPFPHLIIDNFCQEEKIMRLYEQLPDINTKSRDYMFAANKFEKSKFWTIGPLFEDLYRDLTSDRLAAFLKFITNEELFVDKAFHGGGMHQGKERSFLDMHLDFNYHPMHKMWYRNLNLLLYLNKDWKPEYGGHLQLEDLRSGERKAVGVPFNRFVVQKTCNYTLHGYELINFPRGQYRTSIAGYAYSLHKKHIEKPRTTDWHVKPNQPIKRLAARIYDPAVKIKNALFGSATAKH